MCNDRVLSDGMLSGGVLRYCVLSGVLSAACLTLHFRRHLCLVLHMYEGDAGSIVRMQWCDILGVV